MDFYEGRGANKKNGCVEWTMCLNAYGYGVFTRNQKLHYAHRYFYEKKNGDIPKRKCALHKCDNRKCINPDHVFIGTRSDNCRDMGKKNRSPHGIKHCHTKLTEKQVLNIFKATASYEELSKKYGVSIGTVCNIKKKKTWKYLWLKT